MKYFTDSLLDYMYGAKNGLNHNKRNHNPLADGSFDAVDIWSYFFVNYTDAVHVHTNISRRTTTIERKKAIESIAKTMKEVNNHYISAHIAEKGDEIKE